MQKFRILSSKILSNPHLTSTQSTPHARVFRKAVSTGLQGFSAPVVGTAGAFCLFKSILISRNLTSPILCESSKCEIVQDDDVPDLSPIPTNSRSAFVYLCWSLFIGVWVSAFLAPIFVGICLIKGWWDSLLTFMIIWLAGGLVNFPYTPKFADVVASGIESWFSKFKIHHEHAFSPVPSTTDSKRTIYCYHPHGLFSIGAGLLAANLVRRGEKVAIVTSSHMRWFNPILKLLLDMAGIDIVGASPKEVRAAMAKGDRSLILVIGGYEEAVLTKDGTDNIYINNRLGFVKYAMRYNYSLTPVYAFGENDLYQCWDVGKSLRNFLARWKIPVVFFRGNPWFPLLPIRTEEGMKIVVGEPVHVTHTNEPSAGQLTASHKHYVDQLVKLYNRNNEHKNRHLEIH